MIGSMPTDNRVELGQRLRESRIAKGLRQEQVAEAIGSHAVTISKYERGVQDPNTGLLLEMAPLYDVSVDWLLTGQEDSIDDIDIEDPELSLFFRGEWDEFTDYEKEFIREALRDSRAYLEKRRQNMGETDARL